MTTTTILAGQPLAPGETKSPRLLIVEDHPLFRQALVGVLGLAFPDAGIIQATSIDAALDVLTGEGTIDLILLDLSMPGTTGLLGAFRIRTAAPKCALAIVSAHLDPRVIGGAIALGASGYIPKSTPKDELAELIRRILNGAVCFPKRLRDSAAAREGRAETKALLCELSSLTPQQLRVLDMICRGLQNKHVAFELGISVTTVKVHVSEILRKLNVRSRTDAIIKISSLDFDRGERPMPVGTGPSGDDEP